MSQRPAVYLKAITLILFIFGVAGFSHLSAQTVFFSDNYTRANSTNMDASTNGMGGIIITSGTLPVGGANQSPWSVPTDYTDKVTNDAIVVANQVRMGGNSHTVYMFPAYNFANLVATGIVSVTATFVNNGPSGAGTAPTNYDRYDGIGVGFSQSNANAGGGTDRWMQNDADLFVEETSKGIILVYDGPAAGRNLGVNYNFAVPLNGAAGVYYDGTLRIDLMVTNTIQGSNVVYNVLWNGGSGFTNVITGRTFVWSGTSAFGAGTEERSQYSVTNSGFTVSSSSYTPPPVNSIVWRATVNSNWDNSTVNWVDGGLGINGYAFFSGANVVFNDVTASPLVNVVGSVSPGAISLGNVNSNYTFSGTGSIDGAGTLTKSSTGLVTMNSANTFSGGATISSGRLRVGNNNALGSGVITLNGGILSSVGAAVCTLPNPVVIAATTTLGDPNDNGVVAYNGGVSLNGLSQTLLINSTTVFANGVTNGVVASKQGTGTLIIGGNVSYVGTEDVQNGTLIYSNANVVSTDRVIADTASVNGIARLVMTNGTSIVNNGTAGNLRSGRSASTGSNYVDVAAFYSTPNADSADGFVTLQGNAAYSEMTFWPGGDYTARGVTNSGGVGSTVFKFNGGILRSVNPNPAFMQGLFSALVEPGGANIDDGGFAITINQPLLDAGGGLNKVGSGSLTLGAVDTYSGNTVVSNGTLNVTGSLTGPGSVTVMSPATLAGSGTIAGSVSVQPGGSVYPGAITGTPATLTVQGNLTLAGNLSFLVNEALSPSNDLVVVDGVLTNAGTGTLTMNNAGLYSAGDSFKLFNQPPLNGASLTISPSTPGHNQIWTNRLAIDGTIGVVGTAGNPAANLSSLTLSMGTLSPAFSSNTVLYAASVAFTNSSITVTPVSANAGATIQVISGGTTNAVASGSASAAISLNPLVNVIDVRVIAPGAAAINDYIVNLTRTPPNIVLILADDQGFCDWNCYGSEIKTPNINSLAAGGLRFRNYYNAARCSPTRCAILTGLYTQQAAVTPSASLPPLRTDNNVTIAELLGSVGYHTYMSGKWHLGSNPGQAPEQRGFDEVFTYASGTAANEDEWTPSDYRFASVDGETTNINYATGAFYQPDVIGDYCMQFLNNQTSRHTNQPFFLYIPFGSAHFPIEAPQAWADTNVAIYSNGWDVLRLERYTNMLAQGVIDPRYALSPNEGAPDNNTIGAPGVAIPAWSTLSSSRQGDLARRMAIYEAMIQKMDLNIGRVIQNLQQSGQLDNTVIFALSDNGANYEGGVLGSTGGTSGATPLTGTALENMGLSGQPAIQLGGGWAHVSNTPFRLFKHFDHFGGIGTPCIIHWPQGLSRTNQWENQSGHLIDIMATIVDITGVTYPTHWTNSAIGTNYAVLPLAGQSLRPLFNSTNASVPRNLGFEHEGNRAYISGNWKFVTKNFSFYDGSSFANQLELYNLTNDPSEMTNLAYVDLHQLGLMITNWNTWCSFVGDPNSLLVTSLSNAPLPTYPVKDPAPLSSDLFVDTFDRPQNTNTDANGSGMSGSCVSLIPPIGVNAAYYEGYKASGTTSIEIMSNTLWMAVGGGTAENGIQYNFDTPDIASAGGFSVELNVQNINDNGTDPNNKYVGFGVGLSAAQAAGGADISGTGSFRGEVGNPGVSAFFVDLNYAGNIEVWTNGVLAKTISVEEDSGILTASFACTGFTTGNLVTANVFFDGTLVNINPGTNGNSLTFDWNSNNNNYIGLSARASNYAQMDNLAIRKLPLANSLVMDYAMGYGLSGTNAAPGADPDGDGVSNFGEWAFGGNPIVPDAYIAGFQSITVQPGNLFQFTFQRYINYAAAGLQYNYLISQDLQNWTPITPNFISADVNEDDTDYEVVSMQLPATLTTNQTQLFLRIQAQPAN